MKFIQRFQNQERGMRLHSMFSIFLRYGNCGANKQNPIVLTPKKDMSGNLSAKVALLDLTDLTHEKKSSVFYRL